MLSNLSRMCIFCSLFVFECVFSVLYLFFLFVRLFYLYKVRIWLLSLWFVDWSLNIKSNSTCHKAKNYDFGKYSRNSYIPKSLSLQRYNKSFILPHFGHWISHLLSQFNLPPRQVSISQLFRIFNFSTELVLYS